VLKSLYIDLKKFGKMKFQLMASQKPQ